MAIAELDYHDKWQRTQIGLTTLNSHKEPIDKIFNKIIEDTEKNIEGEIVKSQIHYF